MPSDDRATRVLRALAPHGEPFRSAVVRGAEEVRALLADDAAGAAPASARAERELGPFGAGRVDPQRFASLLAPRRGLEPGVRARLERVLEILTGAARAEGCLHLELAPGADLAAAVEAALAGTGRVFGAAQVAELIRSGRFRSEVHDALFDRFPFARWNRAERQIAPPLVVEVEGADLRAAGLADLLDGAMRLVLVVRGEAPPAPLARLITPGVFVMQAVDAAEAEQLAGAAGPAVAAILPEGAARFVHDPAGGPALRDRLRVEHLPAAAEGRRPPGALSAFQLAEELRHLALLAELAAAPQAAAPVEAVLAPPTASAPAGAPPAAGPAAPPPAELLAAWLLKQAEL